MNFAALERLPNVRAWARRPLDAAAWLPRRERARTLRWLASVLSDEATRLDATEDAVEIAAQLLTVASAGGNT